MMSRDAGQKKIIVDADEEITTVIDHLRMVREDDIALVVPQRALILQSVVNLKLLSQEAQRLHKRIVIVTRDQDGIVFAQRAGIMTQPFSTEEERMRVHESLGKDHVQHMPQEQTFTTLHENAAHDFHNMSAAQQAHMAQKRYVAPGMSHEYVGGDDQYIDPVRSLAHHSQQTQSRFAQEKHRRQPTGRGHFDLSSASQKNHTGASAHTAQSGIFTPLVNDVHEHEHEFTQYERSLAEARVSSPYAHRTQNANVVQYGRKKPEGAIAHDTMSNHDRSQEQRDHTYEYVRHIPVKKTNGKNQRGRAQERRVEEGVVSSPARYLVKGLVMGAIVLVFLVSFVIFAPQTTITVLPKNITVDDVVEITARADQMTAESDRRIIPARVIERDITYTKNFSATGKGDVSAQKAQGTITIYNTYNDQPQPIVANTRFLSENGMLFRLVKGTTIPGMKDGEPGKVDALVIADQDGAAGNIGPTRFSIPGFDSGPKKDKFYAISDKTMLGGGEGGSNVSVVSAEDIALAQKEMESGAHAYAKEQLYTMIRPDDEILLPEAIMIETNRSEASVSPDTMSDQFMYEIVMHVYAVAFSERDVTNILAQSVRLPENAQKEEIDMHLTFDHVELNGEDGAVRFSVKGDATFVADVDLHKFKKDIMGKKHDDLRDVIEENYRDTIEKITIERVVPQTPQFLGERISHFSFMTRASVVEPTEGSLQAK